MHDSTDFDDLLRGRRPTSPPPAFHLGAADRGCPEAWETQEQYHRRTGKGFFLGGPSQPYQPPLAVERRPHESDAAYAARLRLIADRLDPRK